MKYQIIALDIDGTLLNMNQEIMPITKQILIDLQKQGVSVVLSSGRDIYSLEAIGEMIGLSHYPQSGYISLNGLEIYDSQKNLLYQAKKLQKEDAIVLDHIAREFHLDMVLFFENQLCILEYGQTHIIDDHFMSRIKEKVADISKIPDVFFQNLRKVSFVQHEAIFQKILPALHKKMDDSFEISLVEPDWIEMTPKGLNKGEALKRYAQLKNIFLSQVIAFGNGENDISMLEIAGCGVAMLNSFDTVKEHANDVCGHCEEDGIGLYLKEKMF